MNLNKKDFISLMHSNKEEILFILETAETMKKLTDKKNKKYPYLQGKSVVNLFYEQSVRARLSYELASQYLSANVVEIVVDRPLDIYENIKEIGKTVDQMGADFIVCRHPMSGSAKFLAENVSASVINAGDGINENPTRALIDLMTIKKFKGEFKGLNVAIIGDVASSRNIRSNIWGLLKLGANVSVAAPPTMLPPMLEQFNVKTFYNVKDAVCGADVIMALRLNSEDSYGSRLASFNEYKRFFKLDEDIFNLADSNAIIMHPGMPHRGVELSSYILESDRFIVDDQVTNGVAIRMALLYLLSLRMGA